MRSRYVFLMLAFVSLVISLTFAQEGLTPTVKTDVAAKYGRHLTDAKGNTLYILARDNQGDSTCTGKCTANWPPLLVTGAPVAGDGVDASLLGTVKRPDGALQVSYNGWPLYTYVRDAKAGEANGEGLGNLFFLIDAAGKEITHELPEKRVQISKANYDALMKQGEAVFTRNCSVCHGSEGEGKVGPRLSGNADLNHFEFVVSRVLFGVPDHYMPAWKDQLTDSQIAAVATYIRNSWSNDYGAVTAEEVKSLR